MHCRVASPDMGFSPSLGPLVQPSAGTVPRGRGERVWNATGRCLRAIYRVPDARRLQETRFPSAVGRITAARISDPRAPAGEFHSHVHTVGWQCDMKCERGQKETGGKQNALPAARVFLFWLISPFRLALRGLPTVPPAWLVVDPSHASPSAVLLALRLELRSSGRVSSRSDHEMPWTQKR